jgi:hypothetical protein
MQGDQVALNQFLLNRSLMYSGLSRQRALQHAAAMLQPCCSALQPSA